MNQLESLSVTRIRPKGAVSRIGYVSDTALIRILRVSYFYLILGILSTRPDTYPTCGIRPSPGELAPATPPGGARPRCQGRELRLRRQGRELRPPPSPGPAAQGSSPPPPPSPGRAPRGARPPPRRRELVLLLRAPLVDLLHTPSRRRAGSSSSVAPAVGARVEAGGARVEGGSVGRSSVEAAGGRSSGGGGRSLSGCSHQRLEWGRDEGESGREGEARRRGRGRNRKSSGSSSVVAFSL